MSKYCMAPFKGAYINNGVVRPCCWYERKGLTNKITKLSDLKNVFYSTEFDKIREDQNRPAACWKCQMHEDKGGKSHRHLWNARHDEASVKLESLDLYMGNLCNLACTMCSSNNSTKWISEEQKLFGEAQRSYQDDIDTYIDYETAKDLNRIKLAGGEVFLMPSHTKLLEQLISYGVAKNITLVYITNCTVDPREFADCFAQFKKVEFILSLDGIEEVSDYVRYHSKWDTINTNVQRALDMGIECSINCTVSVLNVYHLPDLIEWWNNRGDMMFRILDYPNYLSINVLSVQERERVISNIRSYSELQHIVYQLNSTEQSNRAKFEEWINTVDANRGNSFWTINPWIQ